MSAREAEPARADGTLTVRQVLRTPMGRLVRGRLGPAPHPVARSRRGAWRAMVRESVLPIQLRDLVDRVVRRTRLWKGEKLDVALELVAHFRDGIEAGRSADELSATFGDPDRAARLLRHAAKRKRPAWWHAMVFFRRGILAMFTILVGVYLFLFLRYHMGEVVVSHDYLADMNARAAAAPEADRAWPLYRQAIMQTKREGPVQPSEAIQQFGLDRIGPDDPLYPEALDYLRRAAPALDLVRQAAKKPSLGLEIGFQTDAELYDYADGGYTPGDKPLDGWLVGVLLPSLGDFRGYARLLRFDAQVAARNDDADRVFEDIEAILAMGRHVREHPVLISDLVGIALGAVASEITKRTLTERPELLSREQLLALAHDFAAWNEGLPLLQFEGERAFFEDFLQRAFTDDGHGDGFMTSDGLRIAMDAADDMLFLHDQQEPTRFISAAIEPVASVVVAPRKEQQREYDRIMALVQDALAAEPWESDEPLAVLQEESERSHSFRYLPVRFLMPAFGRAITSARQGEADRNATLVAIALELYRREHGSYPTTLADLTPRFLPSVPRDPFDGQPLRYEVRDGVAHVWSIGADRKDDGGRATEKGPWDATVRSRMPLEQVQQTLADPKRRGTIDGDWLMLPAPAWAFTRSDRDEQFVSWLHSRETDSSPR
ncbi:MAG: hypothetical protein RBS39_05480 [Phycisphaerales bacterium]|nr:hypothetical protein [Phycisphaerales bacterium]